ncbi:hypothetical protein QQF64_030770 [Cirrhinus molitorella]|uniref:C-type lectin domain-containing protein n=1 Tax=Cirrhinus molitorella TaxID=172907 RepID=A0ABR3N492_9TELE
MYSTWSGAQSYCKVHHDDLSTVSNEELQLLSDHPIVYPFFIVGLYQNTQNMWKWSTGEPATINKWDFGEPNLDTERCGAVKEAKFHNIPCTWPLPFFCMEVFELILVQQTSTWEEALQYCRRHYTDLAILSSDVIMTETMNKSRAALTDDVWIGLRFIAGDWLWVNGEDLEYKGWPMGEELKCPAMNQRCGVYNVKQMVWKAVDCECRLNFLCVIR